MARAIHAASARRDGPFVIDPERAIQPGATVFLTDALRYLGSLRRELLTTDARKIYGFRTPDLLPAIPRLAHVEIPR
jgi:hypothetical protein